MVILGLIDSKPSAAAIVVDGQLVSAIAEERLCRMKMARGMPRAAISQVMAQSGITPRDIDQVAVAQKASIFEPEPRPWKGWFDSSEIRARRFDQLSSSLAPLVGRFPITW